MSSWSPLPHATCLSCQLASSTDAPRLFSEIMIERIVGSLMPTTLMTVPGRHESSGGCRVRVHLESCGPAPCEAVMWVMGKGLQAMQCLWWKCWFCFRLCEHVYGCVWVCANECSVCGGQKRAWIPWSYSYMVLGAELWSFDSPRCLSNSWDLQFLRLRKRQRN